MKKLVSSVIVAASLMPVLAFAQQSNTVTFKGEVSTQTCEVTINGEKTSPVVLLPTVADTALAAAGATAGDTNFTIDMAGCNAQLTKAKAVFVGNRVTTNGNLGNTGTATNVSIQLADGVTTTALNFNNTDVSSSEAQISATGTATLPFVAKYYAEGGAATAGTVVASAQYAVVYE